MAKVWMSVQVQMMENWELSMYWSLVRLNPAGGYQVNHIRQVHAYLQHLFPDLQAKPKPDRALQRRLAQLFQAGELKAGLSLRCYISHVILQECQALVKQFGAYYGFDVADLLSYVLNDEGELTIGTFKPFGYEILEKYNAEVAALSTWAARLVRQNADLKRCLKDYGLLLISDWGLLNDTKARQLRRILREYFDEAEAITNQAIWVHEAYRFVYLPDRPGSRGEICADPTAEQLQRMVAYIQATFQQSLSPATVMTCLQWSAKRLRQYRLKQQPKSFQRIDPPVEREDDLEIDRFLHDYQQQVLQCLDQSINTVVKGRIQGTSRRIRVTTVENFLQALNSYYCEGLSQGEIAKKMEVSGQDRIAKLLKLTQLRSEIKLHMFACLQNYIQVVVNVGDSPDQLLAIDAALTEQLDQLIQQDQDWGFTTKAHLQQQGSLLGRRICEYLKGLSLKSR
ncbi:hypothetical protein [Stenomitos frigidus]|uniref:Uncharacterized protein n=1 Tax=Stenomitos frigidus ULC18 TaxID=2107698 RepID=A0A2T1DWX7_9CYAN|nr:hypothetical protein [Stenomitos frigidus]PSB24997.1 hypothetical protein C7B82_24880 [Stenomitos frigidus ULC18]